MATTNTLLSLDQMRVSLAGDLARWTPTAGDHTTAISELKLFRRDARTPPGVCMVEPSVVLVAQGVKRMLVGGQGFSYDADHFLIASHDIPASSEVVEASRDRPCLGLLVTLDLSTLAELVAQAPMPPVNESPGTRGMALGTMTAPLMQSFCRLVELLDEPEGLAILAPLALREVHYRLLTSDQGWRLRRLASVGSQSHMVARAIDWLKTHYASPLRIDELAKQVHMSPSTLHHHFRQLTAMSPLQYQKWLRLNQARRLMMNMGMDAASAAFEVGYESPSHFSREYARLFGAPPRRDVVTMRTKASPAASPGR